MTWVETLHLERHDFQAITLLAVIDLGLTMPGILSGSGIEMSPFYRPFTESFGLMLLGAGIYLSLLLGLNILLERPLRTILATTAVGMHIGGILSWLRLYLDLPLPNYTATYMQFIIIAIGTATSYYLFQQYGWIYPDQNN